jgi:hypothetical protein
MAWEGTCHLRILDTPRNIYKKPAGAQSSLFAYFENLLLVGLPAVLGLDFGAKVLKLHMLYSLTPKQISLRKVVQTWSEMVKLFKKIQYRN